MLRQGNLTRRANQGHSFIIPQSCKRPSLRNSGRIGAIAAQILTHIEIAPPRLGDRLRMAKPRACRACQGIST
jgi:hypothetical protein